MLAGGGGAAGRSSGLRRPSGTPRRCSIWPTRRRACPGGSPRCGGCSRRSRRRPAWSRPGRARRVCPGRSPPWRISWPRPGSLAAGLRRRPRAAGRPAPPATRPPPTWPAWRPGWPAERAGWLDAVDTHQALTEAHLQLMAARLDGMAAELAAPLADGARARSAAPPPTPPRPSRAAAWCPTRTWPWPRPGGTRRKPTRARLTGERDDLAAAVARPGPRWPTAAPWTAWPPRPRAVAGWSPGRSGPRPTPAGSRPNSAGRRAQQQRVAQELQAAAAGAAAAQAQAAAAGTTWASSRTSWPGRPRDTRRWRRGRRPCAARPGGPGPGAGSWTSWRPRWPTSGGRGSAPSAEAAARGFARRRRPAPRCSARSRPGGPRRAGDGLGGRLAALRVRRAAARRPGRPGPGRAGEVHAAARGRRGRPWPAPRRPSRRSARPATRHRGPELGGWTSGWPRSRTPRTPSTSCRRTPRR